MKNKYFILFLTLEIFSTGYLLSQPALEWENVYPDSNTYPSSSFALALDDSGNVYITGLEEINQVSNYCTIKYNTSGNQQWVTLYSGIGAGGRIPCAIAIDRQSNVYVTGYSYRYGTIFDFCTVKYNTNGIEQWVRYYDGPIHSYDQAQKIAVDKTGNVYVSGFITINGYDARIFLTIKYTNDGDTVWTRTYGEGDISTNVSDIKFDENNNVYITGGCDTKAVTIKYDSSGNQKWINAFSNGGDHSLATALALDENNYVIITGYTEFSLNRRSYFTIKYSSLGIQQWSKAIEPGTERNSWFQSNSVVIDETNDIYISGFFQPSDTSRGRMFVKKYTTDGDSVWDKIDGDDTISPQFTYMDIDKNNNIYVTGKLYTQQLYQIRLTKYDSSGALKWKISTNYSNANSGPSAIKISSNDNIYITGSKDPLGTIPPQMLTIKYSQPNGIVNKEKNVINNYKLYQNYPNPFNPKTVINYEILTECHVRLSVYDITGREIAVLVNKNQRAGKFKVDFYGTDYSSGIYFYILSVNNYLIDTKKMLIIK